MLVLDFVGLGDLEKKPAGSLTEEAQKRLSIAMVLVADPKLLLLDEPTGGVNLEEIGGLIELVKKDPAVGHHGLPHRAQDAHGDEHVGPHHRSQLRHQHRRRARRRKWRTTEQVIEAYLGARRVA